jgi:hypothetical protein
MHKTHTFDQYLSIILREIPMLKICTLWVPLKSIRLAPYLPVLGTSCVFYSAIKSCHFFCFLGTSDRISMPCHTLCDRRSFEATIRWTVLMVLIMFLPFRCYYKALDQDCIKLAIYKTRVLDEAIYSRLQDWLGLQLGDLLVCIPSQCKFKL